MKRWLIGGLIAALLAIGATLYLTKPAKEQPKVEQSQIQKSAVEIKTGNLSEEYKYFSERELEDLGLEVNLSQTKYLADLDLDLLMLGCPVRDCIPSIDGPEFETVADANEWLKDADLVMGLELDGIVKAYPVKILNWHEIVNDDLNETPIAVTYCPLCNSGLVFVRPTINNKVLEFGVSGRLYKSDLVMYDRQTGSFWPQIEGRAVVGPLAGEAPKLQLLPIDVVPWGSWKQQHPDTLVLSRPTYVTRVGGQKLKEEKPEEREAKTASRARITAPGLETAGDFLRDYDYDPYGFYKINNTDTFGTPFSDQRLPAKANVIGVELGGLAKAYPRELVEKLQLINDKLGQEYILVVRDPSSGKVRIFKRHVPALKKVLEFERREGNLVDKQTGSRWSFNGEPMDETLKAQKIKLEELVGVPSFWFAWLVFHPQTELFSESR